MSSEIIITRTLEGIRYRGNAYIVGLALPGWEQFGRITRLDPEFHANGICDVIIKTEQPCPGESTSYDQMHFVQGVWLDGNFPTSDTYLHDRCRYCHHKVNAWPPPYRFVPSIARNEEGSWVVIVSERKANDTFPWGYDSIDAAYTAGQDALDWDLAAFGNPPFRLIEHTTKYGTVVYVESAIAEVHPSIQTDVLAFTDPIASLDAAMKAHFATISNTSAAKSITWHKGPGSSVWSRERVNARAQNPPQ